MPYQTSGRIEGTTDGLTFFKLAAAFAVDATQGPSRQYDVG